MADLIPKNDVYCFTADGDAIPASAGTKRIVAIVVDCMEPDAAFELRRMDATGPFLWSMTLPTAPSAPPPPSVVSFSTSGGINFSTSATSFKVYVYVGKD